MQLSSSYSAVSPNYSGSSEYLETSIPLVSCMYESGLVATLASKGIHWAVPTIACATCACCLSAKLSWVSTRVPATAVLAYINVLPIDGGLTAGALTRCASTFKSGNGFWYSSISTYTARIFSVASAIAVELEFAGPIVPYFGKFLLV